ncbi:phytanoyl-CoA dioxygenase family protein [Sporothrix schenckii 1099-18]|uniref:Phytanoyl-CoA dioxygenase family protein n=1 Tax=Sporothrix schenckii 1099-18 TaxID=1397361 RepID=A0A0F2M8Y6_SPOSC|nr:phytanoyl-CoA dioxygenase family protein [Sporothrix schenckii 1099-18]KJR86097.1 phytanoyl-CoA dioxygenase family protein [Sporothrix schenckii 1099-18]
MHSASASFDFQEPTVVRLSDEERTTGRITLENIGIAVSAMHRDGLVVLENAVNTAHMDAINAILVKDAEEMAKMDSTHFNGNSVDGRPTGNMSQGPPLEPELLFDDIWANVPAAAVLSAVLGPKPHVNYVNGNTALGGFGDARQRVHADLFFNHAQFPFAVVANYYLEHVSPANGSTELWLGSHRDTSFLDHRNCHPERADTPPSDTDTNTGAKTKEGATAKGADFGIRDERLEARRKHAPPMQPTIKKGSVVLRDLRLWHAGLANPATDPRIMLAFVHTPWWYACPARVVLPASCQAKVDSWAARLLHPVQYDAHFVPASLDHRKVKFDPNFSSANKGYLSMLPPHLGSGYVDDVSKY